MLSNSLPKYRHKKITFSYALFLMSLAIAIGFSTSSTAAKATPKQTSSSSINTQQQNNSTTLRGIIKDHTGEFIIGATVREKGAPGGTFTGIGADFSITVSSPNAVLLFSFIGMEDKEVPLNGANNISVVMAYTAEAIEELVVVSDLQQSADRGR